MFPILESEYCGREDDGGRKIHIHHRLTQETIESILGKPDAVVMKEALSKAMQEKADVQERVRALDHFERLIENVDNAKNLIHLQMYPLLLDLASQVSPDPVRREALWILQTAINKSPNAQLEIIKYEPLRKILPMLRADASVTHKGSVRTRSKAVTILISILNNNMEGIRRMEHGGGWDIIRELLEDDDIAIRRKTVFLFWSLLQPEHHPEALGQADHHLHFRGKYRDMLARHLSRSTDTSLLPAVNRCVSIHTRDAMQKHGIVHTLIGTMITPQSHALPDVPTIDDDYAAEAAKTLIAYLSAGGKLSDSEKDTLRPIIENPAVRCGWDLEYSEWKLMCDAVNAHN